jgi:hypothetical protein
LTRRRSTSAESHSTACGWKLPRAAQSASDRIWDAAPWRWSVSTLAPITVTATAQEFNVVTEPSNILRLEKSFITDGTTIMHVTPVVSIPGSITLSGVPRFVQYVINSGATDIIRFDVKLTSLNTGLTYKFFAWYKKTAPLLSGALTTPGALVMDDNHYNVYEEFVLYYAYRFANDQRAGSAQVGVNANGDTTIAYTGQLGVAMAALEEMRKTENLLWDYIGVPDLMKER